MLSHTHSDSSLEETFTKHCSIDEEHCAIDIRYLPAPCSALSRSINRDFPPSNEEYLERKKPFITSAEFLIVCIPAITRHPHLEEMQRWLDAIRSVRNIQEKILPAFVAVR